MNNRMNVAMTPGPSRSLIHNDENAMNMGMNGMSHKKKKSGGLGLGGGKGGGGGLKSRTSNSNSNSNIMNSNNTNTGGTTKTPMNKSLSTSKSTTSGRRRALGDISNRKGARGSGNGGAGKENTGGGGLSAHTPHKNKQIQIQQIKTNKSETVKKKQGLSHHNATTLKKKTVSFSIHTSEEANIVNVVPAPISNKNKSKSTSKSTSKSVQKAKTRQRQDRVYEDIEVSAGRTWLEEQELLGEETFSLADLSIDIQGTLDDIATIKENDRAMMDRERAAMTEEYEESLRQGELMDLQAMKELEECPIFEEEDDSAIAHLYSASSVIHQKAYVVGGYGIYEDDDDDCSLGLGLELGLGLDDDDLNSIGNDLIADIGDISI